MLNKLMCTLMGEKTKQFRQLNLPNIGYLHLFGAPGDSFYSRVPTLSLSIGDLVRMLVHFPCLAYSREEHN